MSIRLPPEEPPNRFLQGFNIGYDGDLPVSFMFNLVSQSRGWKKGSTRWKRAWQACMRAEYDRLVGSRVTSLKEWQHLCAKVGIEESLPSINKCRKVTWDPVRRAPLHLLTFTGTCKGPRQPYRPTGLLEYPVDSQTVQ